jgi:pyruvate dehydrogenase E1 component beta subunit
MLYFLKGDVPEVIEPIPFGQAIVRRQGTDITVVATQVMLNLALKAADVLSTEGIEVEVIDPRTLVPFDMETIVDSVKKTGRCLIAHEAVERAGWAAEVAFEVSQTAFDHLDAPVGRVCAANLPVPYTKTLESQVIPGLDDVVEGIRSTVKGLSYSKDRGGSRV